MDKIYLFFVTPHRFDVWTFLYNYLIWSMAIIHIFCTSIRLKNVIASRCCIERYFFQFYMWISCVIIILLDELRVGKLFYFHSFFSLEYRLDEISRCGRVTIFFSHIFYCEFRIKKKSFVVTTTTNNYIK